MRVPDCIVYAPHLPRGRTNRHGAGQVAAVSVQDAAKVQHDEVAGGEYSGTCAVMPHVLAAASRSVAISNESLISRACSTTRSVERSVTSSPRAAIVSRHHS